MTNGMVTMEMVNGHFFRVITFLAVASPTKIMNKHPQISRQTEVGLQH